MVWVELHENEASRATEHKRLFTCAEMDRHIMNSGKKHQNSEYHSLPTGLRKAKAFLDLHEIQTRQDQSYFYYRAKCFHSFKVR